MHHAAFGIDMAAGGVWHEAKPQDRSLAATGIETNQDESCDVPCLGVAPCGLD